MKNSKKSNGTLLYTQYRVPYLFMDQPSRWDLEKWSGFDRIRICSLAPANLIVIFVIFSDILRGYSGCEQRFGKWEVCWGEPKLKNSSNSTFLDPVSVSCYNLPLCSVWKALAVTFPAPSLVNYVLSSLSLKTRRVAEWMVKEIFPPTASTFWKK